VYAVPLSNKQGPISPEIGIQDGDGRFGKLVVEGFAVLHLFTGDNDVAGMLA
jgi:hypothetical protein